MTELEIIRIALKAGRGLALDAGERALDQEFANAIEMVDRLAVSREPAGAGLDAIDLRSEAALNAFLVGLDSPNHSPESRRSWCRLFLRDAAMGVLRFASSAEPGLGHGDHPNDGYLYEGCLGCHPAREPAGAGLREALAEIDRLWAVLGYEYPNAVSALLASPAEPGLDAMARYILAHGEHSPFCAYTRGGDQCDCGLREAMDAALALSGPKP